MRLIDADELLKQRFDIRIDINKGDNHYASVVYADDIDDCQTVDAEPVRHGKWLITDAYPHRVYCSECSKTFALTRWEVWEDGSLPRNHCPNCGAKMDKDSTDEKASY